MHNDTSSYTDQDGHYLKTKQKITNAGEDEEKLEHLCTGNGNAKSKSAMVNRI